MCQYVSVCVSICMCQGVSVCACRGLAHLHREGFQDDSASAHGGPHRVGAHLPAGLYGGPGGGGGRQGATQAALLGVQAPVGLSAPVTQCIAGGCSVRRPVQRGVEQNCILLLLLGPLNTGHVAVSCRDTGTQGQAQEGYAEPLRSRFVNLALLLHSRKMCCLFIGCLLFVENLKCSMLKQFHAQHSKCFLFISFVFYNNYTTLMKGSGKF